MATLEEQVLKVVGRLALVNPLTPEAVENSEAVRSLFGSNQKRIFRSLLNVVKSLGNRGQVGKLRAGLLIGITMFGDPFLLQAERAGTFLGNSASEERFNEFLNQLLVETAQATNPDWKILNGRLKCYIVYQQLIKALVVGRRDVSDFLRIRPRRSIKMALILTALSFLRNYFEFQIPTDFANLIDQLGSPENIASIASLLVVSANEYYPLDSLDFAFPVGGVEISELRDLMFYGKTVVEQFEIAKYVTLFRYQLAIIPGRHPTFRLSPPTPEFEYSLRLGFIRSETNAGMAPVDVAARGKASVLSIKTAAEQFAEQFRTRLCEIKDHKTDSRRLRIKLPSIPALYDTIRTSVFYEDLLSDEQDAKDFLIPLRYVNKEEIKLTDDLSLKTFHSAWRYLQFVNLVAISLLRSYAKDDATMLMNSVVLATGEDTMVEFIEGLGLSKEEAADFLEILSADVRHLGFLDLQYQPSLRIAQTPIPESGVLTKPELVYLPTLLCTSNVLRNVQAARKFRVDWNSRIFVEAIAQKLKSAFQKVETNRPVKGERATDIDLVVFEPGMLFLFECKHSLPPTSPHEIRDIWEEIEDGVRQLDIAANILNDPARRQSYLTGWFPGTKPEDTANLKIVVCVLCSHRIFSGLHYNGVPIRDFSSLALLCDDGIVGMGGMLAEDEVVLSRYRIIRERKMSALDLDNYCSRDSVYFKSFKPFMYPITRIERAARVSIARETYVYGVELGEWRSHMEALGCAREPDRRQRLKSRAASDVIDPQESTK